MACSEAPPTLNGICYGIVVINIRSGLKPFALGKCVVCGCVHVPFKMDVFQVHYLLLRMSAHELYYGVVLLGSYPRINNAFRAYSVGMGSFF